MPHNWFETKMAAADPRIAELYLNDFIGGWFDPVTTDAQGLTSPITAASILEWLNALPEEVTTIRAHLNSPGGDVSAALMIANALRDQRAKGRTVETIVDGLAASAASLVAMAGAPVRMADNAILMIHNPWAITLGNSDEMRKSADVLDRIKDASLIPTYQWHSSLSAQEIGAMMDAETWMSAAEAVKHGFADEVVEGLKAAASIDPRHLAPLRVPERFSGMVRAFIKQPEAPAAAAPVPASRMARERVFAECLEAGLDASFAQRVHDEGVTADALAARIAGEMRNRAAAQERAESIRSLFKFGGSSMREMEALAPELIESGLSFDQVKALTCKVAAMLDKIEIDAGLPPELGSRRTKINISAIYAEMNNLRP